MRNFSQPVSVPPPATMPQRSKSLLPLSAVMCLVDKNKDQVLRLIDDGSLLWVWNVSLEPTGARGTTLRVLPACVADHLRGRACQLDWEGVLRLLIPDNEPVLLSKEITRILNVSSEHVYNLARRKLIAPLSTWHRGRGGCARFAAKSFFEFLKIRRFS